MENFLAMAKKGALKSREELQSILDVLPVPVSWATLDDGQILYMNQAFKKTFGYCEADFETVNDWIERTYAPVAEKHKAMENWRTAWHVPGRDAQEIESHEFDVVCANGEKLTVSHRGIVLNEYGIGVATFEDITERKRAERLLRESVLQDPLTQIGNRRALNERWAEEMLVPRRGGRNMAAVLMVDLDHFKPINDNFGHEAGDEVLRMVAKRLKNSVRHTDLVVRMGGDEFAILLSDLADQQVADRICQRLEQAFNAPFNLFGKPVRLGASFGASLYPRDGKHLAALLQRADQALYDIKRNGKGGWNWCQAVDANIHVPNYAI